MSLATRAATALLLWLMLMQGHAALAADCSPHALATAVDEIGAQLRAFNSDTMAALDIKLDRLKGARGWSDAELAVHRQALIDDAVTDAFDQKANEQFTRIDELSTPQAGKSGCDQLEELRSLSNELLATMQAKAAHLNERVEAELKPQVAAATPAPPKTGGKGKAVSEGWSAETSADPAYLEAQRQAALQLVLPPAATGDDTYSIEEIQKTSEGLFGTLTSNLASVIAFAFEKAGRPNGYILGQEAGGAFLAGLRYGDGTLYLKDGSITKVYWHGPSIGADLGASQARTMFLVYHLKSRADIFKLVSGIDGSAFVVGGAGITFLSDGKTVLAPIRTGVGLRLGASAGYLRLTPARTWALF